MSAQREVIPESPPDCSRGERRSARGLPAAASAASGRDAVAPSGFAAVCALADIPVLGARVVARPGHPDGDIAVFRTASDGVFALLDRCPHKGGPLSQGIVYGERVACPLHNWSIELASGAAVAPDVGCAHRFPVRVEDGIVHVGLGGAAP